MRLVDCQVCFRIRNDEDNILFFAYKWEGERVLFLPGGKLWVAPCGIIELAAKLGLSVEALLDDRVWIDPPELCLYLQDSEIETFAAWVGLRRGLTSLPYQTRLRYDFLDKRGLLTRRQLQQARLTIVKQGLRHEGGSSDRSSLNFIDLVEVALPPYILAQWQAAGAQCEFVSRGEIQRGRTHGNTRIDAPGIARLATDF